jgi:hypothetical protein
LTALSPRTHAAIDYPGAVMLAVSPWLFGFAGDADGLGSFCVGLACLLLVVNVLTDYEGGLVSLIPMRAHLLIDVAIAFILALSPWTRDIAGPDATVWVPVLAVALILLAGALLTKDGQAEPARKPRSGL